LIEGYLSRRKGKPLRSIAQDWASQAEMQRQIEVMIDEFRTRLDDKLEKFDLLFKDKV